MKLGNKTDVKKVQSIIAGGTLSLSALTGLITGSVKTGLLMIPVFAFALIFLFGLAIGAGEADQELEDITGERYK